MNQQSADNAIQLDASQQLEAQASGADAKEEGAAQTYVSPRMSAMEAIAASRRASLAEDGVVIETEAKPAPKIEVEPEPDQLASQLAADDRSSAAAAAPQMVKVKVDGEEIEMPLSEVVKSYQKDAAATRRLQQATRLLEDAQRKADSIANNADLSNNVAQQANTEEGAEQRAARKSKLKASVTKLFEGDEDDIVETLDALFEQHKGAAQPATHMQQANYDPMEIAGLVEQQLAVKSAYAQVKEAYPALFADDERGVILGKATLERLTAKESAGISKAQAFSEAAEEVAALFGVQKAGRKTESETRTARDEKLARKAQLDIPSGASAVAGSKDSPAEPPNVSSVIQQMAKARLGQSLIPR